MNDFITLTYSDLQKIIMRSNAEGRAGRYIYSLTVIKPFAATEGIDSSFAWATEFLTDAGKSEPIPSVKVFEEISC